MQSEPTVSIPELTTLREDCLTSAKYLYSAAQQVRNRATKLILKTYAQQRLHFANEIQSMLGEPSQEISLEQTGGSVKRGWMNLQAGLTIQREAANAW